MADTNNDPIRSDREALEHIYSGGQVIQGNPEGSENCYFVAIGIRNVPGVPPITQDPGHLERLLEMEVAEVCSEPLPDLDSAVEFIYGKQVPPQFAFACAACWELGYGPCPEYRK